MELLRPYLTFARRRFAERLHGEFADQERYYMPRPAKLFVASGSQKLGLGREGKFIDPILFFTGSRTLLTREYHDQPFAVFPSVSLVMGQYGMGKTELVHRLVDAIFDLSVGPGPPPSDLAEPLPIGLTGCREALSLLDQDSGATPESFGRLVFREGWQEFGDDFAMEDLRAEILAGRILLVLDGLDELVNTPLRHRRFFEGLRTFLTEGGGARSDALFRVIVTMRLEYLSSMDTSEGQDMLARLGAAGRGFEIFSLVLGPFDRLRVAAYLRATVPKFRGLFEEIAKRPELLETLRRPLLLRIFAELAREDTELDRLLGLRDAWGVINLYVTHASERAAQAQAYLDLSYVWDNDKLALKSVQLFVEGRPRMTLNDIRDVRTVATGESRRRRKQRRNGGSPGDSEEDPLLSINKCPFLLRVGKEEVRFSHRAFLEFFVVEGIAHGVKNAGGDTEEFNSLVLNVDMRKFLRSEIRRQYSEQEGPYHFYGRKYSEPFHGVTMRSYGLASYEGWGLSEKDFAACIDRLDEHRINLLDGMTEPEKDLADVEITIRWLVEELSENEVSLLHPCYRMYCFEGVAVYLSWREDRVEWSAVRARFGDLLRLQLARTLDDLRNAPAVEQEGFKAPPAQLLVERILHISLRLRFEWVRLYSQARHQWLRGWEENSMRRIAATLMNIDEAYF
jgi:hypothetical protein